MPDPDFLIRQNDTASLIYATLTDEDDQLVSIESAAVVFQMAPIGGGPVKVQAEATNEQSGDAISGTNVGEVSYEWQTGDTDTPGLYLAEWEVTFTDESVETFPNGGYTLVRITAEVATAAEVGP
jgi:aryl-phospho-beta-D-glucosidase BglC (GH1 family)